jgi:hypothetical protein
LSFHLTNCINKIPSWETNSCSASQEIPRLLWNLKVHYRVHKNPSLVPILSQMNPVHNLIFIYFKIHFHIVVSFVPRSSKRSLTIWFQSKILYAFLFFPCVLLAPPMLSSLIWSTQ